MSMFRRFFPFLPLLALCALQGVRAENFQKVGHPFLLWNQEDVRALRAVVGEEGWGREAWAALETQRGIGQTHRNLLRYLVTGERQPIEGELKYLIGFAGAKVDSRPWSDHHLSVLRYDVLRDLLSEAERLKIEETFRVHIRHELENDTRNYQRFNWLPNMQWCRKTSAMLMAVVLQDEELIRAMFAGRGGWKYYFDDYVTDGQFYNEEFGKKYSVIGKMLLWCRGLERLGLDGLGYGYTGKGGANMRSYLRGYQSMGYPRVGLGTSRPHYPRITMGDAKGGGGFPGHAFQHGIVQGYLSNGSGGNRLFTSPNMNGRDHRDQKVDQFLEPGWFEIAHAKWPEDRWDYFLFQMRAPDEDMYIPTLLFGWQPIRGEGVAPPPAPSGVYPERGLVMLRHEESPAYWESAAPALAMRLATQYVHEVPDCFALLGYYAFNRPIYINRQVSGGYAGTDPGWSNSIRSHTGVTVDGVEPARIGEVPTTHRFGEMSKWVMAWAENVYPDVKMARGLLLTESYLLDVYHLASLRPRAYQWLAQTLGHAVPDRPGDWAQTRHLLGSLYDLERESSSVVGAEPWRVTVLQETAGADRNWSGLGESWFEPPVGVRLHMMGESGTLAYTALGPATSGDVNRLQEGAEEPGGLTLVAARNKPRTTFIAVHEPFVGHPKLLGARALARGDDAALIEVRHDERRRDWIAVSWAEDASQTRTLSFEGHTIEFRGHALLRFGDEDLRIEGDLAALSVSAEMPVPGAIFREGKSVPPVKGPGGSWGLGDLEPGRHAAAAEPEPEAVLPLLMRWNRTALAVPTHGEGEVELRLRHVGNPARLQKDQPNTFRIALSASPGVRLEPEEFRIHDLAPGGQIRRTVRFSTREAPANTALAIEAEVEVGGPQPYRASPARLELSSGVRVEVEQIRPRDFARVVSAPRYTLKVYYMRTVAAGYVLDPDGLRRFGTGAIPQLSVMREDGSGRIAPVRQTLGGYNAFSPSPRDGREGEPKFLADMGQHPHGARSPFEMRFYENWWWLRYKDGADQRVVYDFGSGDERVPGAERGLVEAALPALRLLADAEGQVLPLPVRPTGLPISASFIRPAGYRYGRITLLPEGSTREGDLNVSPGDQAVAFTFGTEEEFAGLVDAWRNGSPPVPVRPWGQGDMNP